MNTCKDCHGHGLECAAGLHSSEECADGVCDPLGCERACQGCKGLGIASPAQRAQPCERTCLVCEVQR